MKVKNTTKADIDAGEFLFAAGEEIDVPAKVADELVKVKGLEKVVEKPAKRAKK